MTVIYGSQPTAATGKTDVNNLSALQKSLQLCSEIFSLEKNLLEILTARLVVTFSLGIDKNFSQQEFPRHEIVLQGCHGTGKKGNLKVHFSRQEKHRKCTKILKIGFYTGNLPPNTRKILRVKKNNELVI